MLKYEKHLVNVKFFELYLISIEKLYNKINCSVNDQINENCNIFSRSLTCFEYLHMISDRNRMKSTIGLLSEN